MRSHCALYVDAGYLLASAAARVTGTSLRSGVKIQNKALIDGLIKQAEAESGLPLLRVNWYDSAVSPGGAPDPTQDAIGMLPRVKLRLGRMSPGGEQKGVDLRIGLDLTTHGRNRVVDVMYLVSGDDDLTEAVEEAQGHGVQVIVLAAPDAAGRAHAVSRNLQREADGLLVIDPAIIDTAVTRRLAPADVAAVPATASEAVAEAGDPRKPSPADLAGLRRMVLQDQGALESPRRVWTSSSIVYTSDAISGHAAVDEGLTPELLQAIDQAASQVARAWLATATPEEQRQARDERPYVPAGPDAALLTDLSGALETYYIEDSTRRTLREHFWLAVDEQLASSS
jgi:uncharacterized LabA/DUF88 family protein